MSTFCIAGRTVSVTAVEGVVISDVLASYRFRSWVNRLSSEIFVQSIHIQSVDWFGGRVGFIKMVVEATDPDGNKLPGVVFLRGDSVTVFVVLECDGREYVALVAQPRLAVGELFFLEIAGGMIEEGGTFVGQAAKELKEELGLVIRMEDLIDLVGLMACSTFNRLVPSQGACDEALHLFLYRSSLSREALERLHDRRAGVSAEDERIRVCIVPIEEACSVSQNMTTWTAYLLYEKFKARLLR